MTTHTTGQVAYEAYMQSLLGMSAEEAASSYPSTIPRLMEAWEAVAQAVLAQKNEVKDSPPCCCKCGQQLTAHPQEGEPWRCGLSDGPLLPAQDY